jgi:hypothetical protein
MSDPAARDFDREHDDPGKTTRKWAS